MAAHRASSTSSCTSLYFGFLHQGVLNLISENSMLMFRRVWDGSPAHPGLGPNGCAPARSATAHLIALLRILSS
eukprot:12400294-Karenia_brevis.AAC.1